MWWANPWYCPAGPASPSFLWTEWLVKDGWLWLNAGDVDHTETSEVSGLSGWLSLPGPSGSSEPSQRVPLWACSGFVFTPDDTWHQYGSSYQPVLGDPPVSSYVVSHGGRYVLAASSELIKRNMLSNGKISTCVTGTTSFSTTPVRSAL